jgi:hypothetical protein
VWVYGYSTASEVCPAADELHDLDLSSAFDALGGPARPPDDFPVQFDSDALRLDAEFRQQFLDGDARAGGTRLAVYGDVDGSGFEV